MKKRLALVLSLVMGLSLVGCGSSSSSSGDSTSSSSSSSSSGTTISLSVSGTESDAYTQGIKDLVADFNANNEYGVTIETEFQATSDYKTKLSTMVLHL